MLRRILYLGPSKMCGRYTIHTSWQVIAELFEFEDGPPLIPRYNVAPSQDVPVVRLGEDNKRHLELMRWGLIPSWADDPKIGYKLINARAETVNEKPAFRKAFKQRRCLIAADGFFEWKKTETGKQAYWIHLKGKQPFGFAGLWEYWRAPDSGREIVSCTIIVTEANEFVRDLHDRMPVILPKEVHAQWLDPKRDTNGLIKLLKPYNSALMSAEAVSSLVNSPKNDEPGCIRPLTEPMRLRIRKL